MAETARGTIAEALQEMEAGRKLSQQDMKDVLNVAYAQMTEHMDIAMEQAQQYEARIRTLENFITNGSVEIDKLRKEADRALDSVLDARAQDGEGPTPMATTEYIAAKDLRDMVYDLAVMVHREPGSERPTRERPGAYAKLMDVLNRAHDQAAFGKGLDRHVSKEAQPFDEQPICSLQRIYGNGYAFGQVGKKMEESFRLPKKQAVEELLGGLVYLAAAVIVREEGDGEEA